MADEPEAPKNSLVSFSDFFGIKEPTSIAARAVVGAIRRWAAPWLLKRDAKATAASFAVLTAEAKAHGLEIASADIGVSERAEMRAHAERVQEQRSIEAVIVSAVEQAEALPPPAGGATGGSAVDPDWVTRLFGHARHVTREDMLKVWGRVLALEANAPGSFSYRALDTLSRVMPDEAEIFRRACQLAYRTEDGRAGLLFFAIERRKKGEAAVTYSELGRLESAGLFFHEGFFVSNLLVPVESARLRISGAPLIVLPRKPEAVIQQDGRDCLNVGAHSGMTSDGAELMQLIKIEANDRFVDLAIAKLSNDRIIVERESTT
jgi:hypothetical protein